MVLLSGGQPQGFLALCQAHRCRPLKRLETNQLCVSSVLLKRACASWRTGVLALREIASVVQILLKCSKHGLTLWNIRHLRCAHSDPTRCLAHSRNAVMRKNDEFTAIHILTFGYHLSGVTFNMFAYSTALLRFTACSHDAGSEPIIL